MKTHDLVVRTGEYIDKNGEKKGRFKNIGIMAEKDGKSFILLDRTFNPAGAPNPDNQESVLISMFAPKEKQNNSLQFDNEPF